MAHMPAGLNIGGKRWGYTHKFVRWSHKPKFSCGNKESRLTKLKLNNVLFCVCARNVDISSLMF